jgi:hypothetical protein
MGSFLVVYYGNTGSSWLIETLGSAASVVIPAFEPLEWWAWQAGSEEKLAWLHNAFSPPAERNGPAFEAWLKGLEVAPGFEQLYGKDFSSIGFKMTCGAIPDAAALLGLLKERATKLVILQRRNRIKHALSLYRYHEEQKSQFERAGVRPPTRLKRRRFDYWVQDSIRLHEDSEAFKDQAETALGSSALVAVQYEEFVTAPGKTAVIDRLSGFLEIESPAPDTRGFEKATPDDLRSAVINYSQLRRWYRGNPLAVHFDE